MIYKTRRNHTPSPNTRITKLICRFPIYTGTITSSIVFLFVRFNLNTGVGLDNIITDLFKNEGNGFHTVFNNIAEGVIVANENGEFMLFNQVAEEILGVGLLQIEPDKWSDQYGCYYPDRQTPFPSEKLPLAKTIRTGGVYRETLFIKNHIKSDGVFVDISSSPLLDEQCNIMGGLVIFKDITDQQETQIELKKLSNVVTQTADAVMITNTRGIIEYVNPAFALMMGYNSDEVIGKTPHLLKSGQHEPAFYKDLWDTILDGNPYKTEMINKKKNGDLIYIQNTITPLIDENHAITHFVAVMKDITEMKIRKEQELRLKIAREIQQRLLQSDVKIPGFDIAGRNFPADETGGDYFDVIPADNGGLWLTIADVSNHGIGSALIMAGTRAYLRAFIQSSLTPGEVLEKLNNELHEDLNDVQFVTMLLVYIDTSTCRVIYSGAGHVPGFLIDHQGNIIHELNSTGIPLGYQKNVPYENVMIPSIIPRSMFVFSTDGIMEAQDKNENEFGFERLIDSAYQNRKKSALEIIDEIYKDVRTFTGNDHHEDDITLSICKINST